MTSTGTEMSIDPGEAPPPIPHCLETGDIVSLVAQGVDGCRQLRFFVEDMLHADQAPSLSREGYQIAIKVNVLQDSTTKPEKRLHGDRNGYRPLLVLTNNSLALAEGGGFDYVNPNQSRDIQSFGYYIEQLRIHKPRLEAEIEPNLWQKFGQALRQIVKGERGINDFILRNRFNDGQEYFNQVQERKKNNQPPKPPKDLPEDHVISLLLQD